MFYYLGLLAGFYKESDISFLGRLEKALNSLDYSSHELSIKEIVSLKDMEGDAMANRVMEVYMNALDEILSEMGIIFLDEAESKYHDKARILEALILAEFSENLDLLDESLQETSNETILARLVSSIHDEHISKYLMLIEEVSVDRIDYLRSVLSSKTDEEDSIEAFANSEVIRREAKAFIAENEIKGIIYDIIITKDALPISLSTIEQQALEKLKEVSSVDTLAKELYLAAIVSGTKLKNRLMKLGPILEELGNVSSFKLTAKLDRFQEEAIEKVTENAE